MSQSKEFNLLRSLTLKVKPKRNYKYLPSYLPTYLPTYLVQPTFLVPPTHLNIDYNLFWPNFKNATWHISIMPCVTIKNKQ